MRGTVRTAQPEGGVWDDFAMAVLTLALEKYDLFLDVRFREELDTVEMKGISVQVHFLATDASLNIRGESSWHGSE